MYDRAKSYPEGLLTFSLDLKHTYCVLRAEGAELAGGQRVAAALRHRRAHVERLHERHCAHHWHGLLCFSPKRSEREAAEVLTLLLSAAFSRRRDPCVTGLRA